MFSTNHVKNLNSLVEIVLSKVALDDDFVPLKKYEIWIWNEEQEPKINPR